MNIDFVSNTDSNAELLLHRIYCTSMPKSCLHDSISKLTIIQQLKLKSSCDLLLCSALDHVHPALLSSWKAESVRTCISDRIAHLVFYIRGLYLESCSSAFSLSNPVL
jgi:hypothetical protein